MNKNRNKNEISDTIKQYKDTGDIRCSNDDQIKLEWEKKVCYTVLADTSLIEEYSAHCITRQFSLFYILLFSVMTFYSVISVAGSM